MEGDAAVRRTITHAITTLDVCRRKWQALHTPGIKSLTSCVNGRLTLAHAESNAWPPGFAAVRRGVACRANRERQTATDAIQPVLTSLEEIVASMRVATTTLRDKIHATLRGRPLSAEVEQLIASVEAMVGSFERELQLRRAVTAEITDSDGGHAAPGWDASSRLLLSAWVLEPYLDNAKLDLLMESLAAEPSQSPNSRQRQKV